MHVLQLIPSLEVGGVERGVLDLARGLIARGHRVTVASSGGALVEPLQQLGAQHLTLPIHEKSPQAARRALPALCRVIQEQQIDVLHARSRVPAWIGYVAARRTGRPFITTCHGFYRPHPASRVMTWGRTVIVPSDALARYLIDAFHVPPERLRVIPRGVDLTAFAFRGVQARPQAAWRIGLVGRLSQLKGHAVALRAMHQLVQHRLPVTLCVIGDAPPQKPKIRQQLEGLARELGVAHAVEWLGTRHDVPELLRTLDVLIAPSTYPESFGRMVIEAQAVGVPVVASRIGALAEIVEDSRTGLLVRPNDPTELAGALRRIIDDDELRRTLIEQGRDRVQTRFGLERMVDETIEVYTDCLARPRILIWKLSALGDLVLISPSLRAIRRRYPDSPITVVVGRPLYEAVARCPYVSDVLVYDSTRKDRTLLGKWRFIRRLRRLSFDRSLDLQNSRLTHGFAWAAGIPTRIGYARRWSSLLTQAVPLPNAPMPPVAHQHVLLKAADIQPDGEHLEVWPSDLDEQAIEQWLREAGIDLSRPLVGLHPGSSGRWKTKQWELDRWAALCDQLAAEGVQVVLTGSPAEQPLGEELLRLAKSTPWVAIGQTRFLELACLIRRCWVLVTTDSAPLHVAAAVGTPAVALFGPTDPARHVPAGAQVIAISKRVFCSPCYSPRCRTVTHACMKRIDVEEVLGAIRQSLARRRGEPIGTSARGSDHGSAHGR